MPVIVCVEIRRRANGGDGGGDGIGGDGGGTMAEHSTLISTSLNYNVRNTPNVSHLMAHMYLLR